MIKNNRYPAFIRSVENGREFYLACLEGDVRPEDIIQLLELDGEFLKAVNRAKRIAYEKVQAALYDSAAAGNASAIKLWLAYRAEAFEEGERLPDDHRVARIAREMGLEIRVRP